MLSAGHHLACKKWKGKQFNGVDCSGERVCGWVVKCKHTQGRENAFFSRKKCNATNEKMQKNANLGCGETKLVLLLSLFLSASSETGRNLMF